jgi:hypothetical protein
MNINKISWLLGVMIVMQQQEQNAWHWQRIHQLAQILSVENEQDAIEELIQRHILLLSGPPPSSIGLDLISNILHVLRAGRRPQCPKELILQVIETWIERDGVVKARENSELQLSKTLPSVIAAQGNDNLEREYKKVLIEMRNTFSWFLGRTRDA